MDIKLDNVKLGLIKQALILYRNRLRDDLMSIDDVEAARDPELSETEAILLSTIEELDETLIAIGSDPYTR